MKKEILKWIIVFILAMLASFVAYKLGTNYTNNKRDEYKDMIMEEKCSNDNLEDLGKEIEEYEKEIIFKYSKIDESNKYALQQAVKDLDEEIETIEEEYPYFICNDRYIILLNTIYKIKNNFENKLKDYEVKLI